MTYTFAGTPTSDGAIDWVGTPGGRSGRHPTRDFHVEPNGEHCPPRRVCARKPHDAQLRGPVGRAANTSSNSSTAPAPTPSPRPPATALISTKGWPRPPSAQHPSSPAGATSAELLASICGAPGRPARPRHVQPHRLRRLQPVPARARAGYPWAVGENLEAATLEATVVADLDNAEQLLFADMSVPGRGHRIDMLNPSANEVGATSTSPARATPATRSLSLGEDSAPGRRGEATLLGLPSTPTR